MNIYNTWIMLLFTSLNTSIKVIIFFYYYYYYYYYYCYYCYYYYYYYYSSIIIGFCIYKYIYIYVSVCIYIYIYIGSRSLNVTKETDSHLNFCLKKRKSQQTHAQSLIKAVGLHARRTWKPRLVGLVVVLVTTATTTTEPTAMTETRGSDWFKFLKFQFKVIFD